MLIGRQKLRRHYHLLKWFYLKVFFSQKKTAECTSKMFYFHKYCLDHGEYSIAMLGFRLLKNALRSFLYDLLKFPLLISLVSILKVFFYIRVFRFEDFFSVVLKLFFRCSQGTFLIHIHIAMQNVILTF